jgi:SWI/SNF-related matrix-associated actin-dependent regulator of chromatin subfamily A member 5
MREKTTVVVEDAELGRVEVDRWSVEQARHEEELAKRAKQAAAAAAGSGRKIGHEDNCAHCKEDLRIQTAVVSTEVDASSGRVVKRRRIASAIPNFLCPGCPVALHGRCAAVVGCVAGTLGGRPNCPGHRCRLCDRSGSMAGGLLFRCVDCITGTVCFDCAERLGILDDVEYLENHGRWESNFNYFPPGTYEYIRCAECRQRRKQ